MMAAPASRPTTAPVFGRARSAAGGASSAGLSSTSLIWHADADKPSASPATRIYDSNLRWANHRVAGSVLAAASWAASIWAMRRCGFGNGYSDSAERDTHFRTASVVGGIFVALARHR